MKTTWNLTIILALGTTGLVGCDKIEAPVPPAVASTLTVAEQQTLDNRETQTPAPAVEQRAFWKISRVSFAATAPAPG